MAHSITAHRLRRLLAPSTPALAMASHSPLSAKLAAQAGFPAIWASGFELSALYAVPDANILPVSTHLEMTRSIVETVGPNVPVIADLDTGGGNAVNVSYMVRKYKDAGCAAVVMEDKVFPKDSSLRVSARHVLVTVEEFQGKIGAAKAAAGEGEDGMLVVARTEALIAGLRLEEALNRAEAYTEAGADAILIHSKQKNPDEILDFCQRWSGKVPLVIVPTSYPQLSFQNVAELNKVGLIICGNHSIRAAVKAMRETFERIIKDNSIAGVEGDIASVKDVFELQGDAEMREIEKKYLR
ncbi:phosphonopyruvate hydrolase [Cyphellophora europaea CBS 101466]|uniref:Phosphonopyruvate hydrolase n=1 Tax=Cyphellophora europaea (strain CBS 101466) TaxID=1220924 RepID=W2RRE6_CYPE1|nr:phosphonopyruvate hydrolase [Cyphellophora europaea CBS 101466]ETN39032.1 phosphonopyruvate hydrolase [Cyphellophora europaea CBS 101466]